MSALRSILASFDIEVNSKKLDAGASQIDKMIGKLSELGVALLAWRAIKGFAHWGEEVAKAAREVEFHAGRMEMDTDAYQKLSQVAENYGMTMENLQIANTLFTRALGNAGGVTGVLGGHSRHAAAAFKSLGLSAAQFKGQKLEDILPVISDAMLKIKDPMERVTAGLNLFGHRGRSIMPMMAQGGDAIRRAFAAAVPVFEKATIEAANKAAIAGKQLSRVWENLINNSVGAATLTAFSKLADKLADVGLWLKKLSKDSEIGNGVLISLGITAAAVGVWLLVAFAPVLVPILAVVAAFGLLAAAIDEIIVFMEGGDGDSLIGRFFGPEESERLRTQINDIWTSFKGLWEEVKKIGVPAGLAALSAVLEAMLVTVRALTLAMPGVSPGGNASGYGLDKNPDGTYKLAPNGTPGARGQYGIGDKSNTFDPNGFAGALNIPAPMALQGTNEITHRPTEEQAKAGITFNMIGTLDPGELVGRLKREFDAHQDQAVGRAYREALAAQGGAK